MEPLITKLIKAHIDNDDLSAKLQNLYQAIAFNLFLKTTIYNC